MAVNGLPSRETLAALPKIDLHRHLEGSLRLTTIQAIAREYGLGLSPDPADLRPLVQVVDGDPCTFSNFLSKFTTLRQLYQSPEIIARVAAEAVADAAADNVRYLELRFTPLALTRARGFALEDVADWVLASVNRAAEEHGITVRLIASVNRHESLEIAEQVLRVALDRRAQGVVGIDLAGDEFNYACGPFAGVFKEGKQEGLGVTAHGGEWSGADSVRDAIQTLEADRIGHGVRVLEDASVTQLAIERGTAFEVCLTSNVQSGAVNRMQDHPYPDMAAAGLRATINTDDPGVSDISLTDELAVAVEQLGVGLDGIKDAVVRSAASAFLPSGERAALVAQFKKWLDMPPA